MERIDIDEDFEEFEELEEEIIVEEPKIEEPVDKNFPFSIPVPKEEELEKIILKKSNSLLFNAIDLEGWDYSTTGEDKGIKTYFKYMKDSPIVYMKAISPVINCCANTLVEWIYSPESTKQMDEMFLSQTLLKRYDDDNNIFYAKYSAPWPIWPRDFTFLWNKRWTKDG
jgi:hypothetical protein